jgi:acetolactate synthase I/III small subunit
VITAPPPDTVRSTTRSRVLSVIVEDHPGVLFRVSGMIRRRGFNIQSLSVGPSSQPGRSRMTLAVDAGHAEVDQVEKQLDRLIEVIEIEDLTDRPMIQRELAIVKCLTPIGHRRDHLVGVVSKVGGRVIDAGPEHVIVEIAGDFEKVEKFLEALRPYGVSELARSGPMAMAKGPGRV